MESGLAIEVAEVPGAGDVRCVTLRGPIDAKSVLGLKAEIAGLQSRGVRRFILDLSDVKYVNSTGLAFLINLAESSGNGKAAVVLVGMQPKVKIVFDTMGVTDFFGSAASVAAAVKALGKPAAAPKPAPVQKKAAPPKPVQVPKRTAPPAIRPALPAPAPAVKREHSSTKTGRVRPPTTHQPPPSKNIFARFFRRLFGRK